MGRDIVVGAHHANRKRAHDSTFSTTDRELEVANLGTVNQGDFDIYGKCGGPMGFLSTSSNTTSMERKGMSSTISRRVKCFFYYHQSIHLKLDYHAWVAEGVRAPTPIIRQEVKVGSPEITGMNFIYIFI